jgi:acyl carrier protein
VKQEIIEIINALNVGIDLNDPDLNIADDMDSMDIIALIAELEDHFGITISMREKTEANFRNVDTLAVMVERLR